MITPMVSKLARKSTTGYHGTMPHIHTRPGQHDLTASAFIFRLDKSEPMVMLHTHIKIGKLLHFGGHVELNEDPWQTIVREVKEESGYDIGQLRLLQPKNRVKHVSSGKLIPYPVCVISVGYYGDDDKNHYHDDLCFAFVADEEPANARSNRESDDIRLFKREELAALNDGQVVTALRELGEFVFDECLKNWEQIPADKI